MASAERVRERFAVELWKSRGPKRRSAEARIGLTDAHTAGVGAGATVNGEGASLGLWVWVDPKMAKSDRVIQHASGLDASWDRGVHAWVPIGAYRPLDGFTGCDDANAWLCTRLGELKNAGVLDLVDELNRMG